jgi:hypothetical protein
LPVVERGAPRRHAHSRAIANKGANASSGLVDVLLKIGRERQHLMESLREAPLRDDDAEALERARELTGLSTKRSIVTSPSTQAGS